MALILIIEDEVDLVHTLEYNFQQQGYTTRTALNGEEALFAILKEPIPDLVILDLMLPDIPGTQVCRRIRNHEITRHVPVLMLTARSEEVDRVIGFEVGADDYVAKPFSVRELMLRVKAILRRSQLREEDESTPSIIEFGSLRIDIPGCQVWINDEPARLTALEFRLLETLFVRRGRAQTREVLLSDVWDITVDVMTRTVDTHIKRLREKLGPAGVYIETLRGIGYRFVAEPSGELSDLDTNEA